MTIARVYQDRSLELDAIIELDDKTSHYLAHVLRAKPKQLISLFNGRGGEYEASILSLGKKKVQVLIQAFSANEVESPLNICLAQGIARGEKMDFIIQKAVELGVHTIVPLLTAFTNVKLDEERADKRLAHWQAVAISACEQSGRNRLPEIKPPSALNTWLPTVKSGLAFILTPEQVSPLSLKDKPQQVTLLVGPEGGFSPTEVKAALQNGFKPLQLGSRIMRTETAGLAALAIFQSRYGDLIF